jgi:putative transposase
MPQQLRIAYPAVIYHVMSRGDRREQIFLDDVERRDFLKTLAPKLSGPLRFARNGVGRPTPIA